MENMNILKELFDDKILKIINLFMKFPEKQFYLTEVSNLSKVNVSTTLRILNKLVLQGFIKSKVIGKIRLYQLDRSQKTYELMKFLRKDEQNPVEEFLEKIKAIPRIKKVVIETRKPNSAKLLIVGDYISKERLTKICEDIKKEHNFEISYVEISESQFEGLKGFGSYGLDKKIIWERKDE